MAESGDLTASRELGPVLLSFFGRGSGRKQLEGLGEEGGGKPLN